MRTSEKILATPLVCQSFAPDFHNFCQCVENKTVISFIAANKSFVGRNKTLIIIIIIIIIIINNNNNNNLHLYGAFLSVIQSALQSVNT